ncbi:MAG: hypothetical protein HN826_14085 [Methylococcales bacterium]|nr:hypothetical protein [Methylococcales bacterium]
MCLKPADGLLQEPPFAPQIAPTLNTSERILLRIAHTSHFIDRVTTSKNLKGHQVAYQLSDYNDLRSIKIQGSTKYKSLFQENGIIAGTQRGERWILWPMGIPGPGEMRQRGHHATAFLGKKHFDDIDLLERSFERCR